MLRVISKLPLGWLVRIGRSADCDLLARLHFVQLLSQQPRGLLLHVDLALEVEPVVHLHELVRVARIAVFAGELAAAIRIDRPRERHLPLRDAAVQKAAGRQREVLHVVSLADGFALSRELGNPDRPVNG